MQMRWWSVLDQIGLRNTWTTESMRREVKAVVLKPVGDLFGDGYVMYVEARSRSATIAWMAIRHGNSSRTDSRDRLRQLNTHWVEKALSGYWG